MSRVGSALHEVEAKHGTPKLVLEQAGHRGPPRLSVTPEMASEGEARYGIEGD